KAKKDGYESQPAPARLHCFRQVTSDQILGTFTFWIDTGWSSACARNAGRSRSDLNPMCTVNGEMARSIEANNGFGLRKWFRKIMRPPGRHTRRISRATATGSGTTLIRYGAYTMSKE